jgi:NAD-dependent deacetylase
MEASAALARLIAASRRVAIFTGAGISTESGIPDFRSPGGVWSKMKPITYQEFVGSREKRRDAWTRAFTGAARWTGAEPNAGHRAVAQLLQRGPRSVVITQNVDNLHQHGGAPAERVIELHGNASYARCLECQRRSELEVLRPLWEAGREIVCEACGGLVKTATISFGQPMPVNELTRATEEAEACDLFLVLGSSLAVYPAAGLPLVAKRAGAALAIVNREPTEQDNYADLVLHTEIGPLLTAIMARLARS